MSFTASLCFASLCSSSLRFVFLLFSCLLGMSLPTFAQPDITTENIERWADEIFGKALDEKRFSGAAIAVVRGSDLIFSKGYGYADYGKQIAMNPASTKVRVCSNSKTMVATGLMQLMERGLISSMDDPANTYLKRIQLGNFAGTPVTIRDLVTHRAGYEDSYFNAATEVKVTTPLPAETIERLIPDIVRKPGTLSVYSNAAAALQGVLIEDVTGMPLPEYLEENLFAPLGMENTSLNIGPPFPEGHAKAYVFTEDGRALPVPIVAKHPLYAPSGGVFSTAEDMSRFISAHLTQGESAKSPILSKASFAQMHRPLVRNHGGLPAIGVNFFIEELNGSRFISHGCGLPGFTTYLAFLPEKNIGVFISLISKRRHQSLFEKWFGGEQENSIRPVYAAKFCYGFLKEFIGYAPNEAEPNLTEEQARNYTGRYVSDRRMYSNMISGLELFFGERVVINVGYDGAGALTLNDRGPYVGQGDDVFRRGAHPAQTYAFDMGGDGKAIRLLRYGAFSASKVNFWRDPGALQGLLKILAGILVTGIMCLKYEASSRVLKKARFIPALALGLMLVIFTMAHVGFASGWGIEEYINNGHTLRLMVILICSNMLALLGLLSLGVGYRMWQTDGGLGVLARVHYSILFAALLGLLPIMLIFNLVGAQMP